MRDGIPGNQWNKGFQEGEWCTASNLSDRSILILFWYYSDKSFWSGDWQLIYSVKRKSLQPKIRCQQSDGDEELFLRKRWKKEN